MDPNNGPSSNNPTVTAPSIPPPPPPTQHSPPLTPSPPLASSSSKSKAKIILGSLVGLLVLGASLFVGLSLADAYRSLPFTHPLTRQVGNAIILNLPILPKTPEQVVQASIIAHSKVSSAHFNASLATSSKSLISVLGSENFDLVVEGDIDWTDVEKPRSSLNLNISNQFSGDLSYMDEALYFKINMLPQGVLGMFAGLTGTELSAFDPLLNQWVKIEQKALDSGARDLLENSKEKDDETPFDEAYRQTLEAMYEEDILPNLTMKNSDKDGVPVHHLNLTLTGDSINRVVKKLSEGTTQSSSLRYALDTDEVLPSDVIKDITLDLYINKDNYYLNNLSVTSTIDNQAILNEYSTDAAPLALDRETYRIASALSLTNIGAIQPIAVPSDSVSLDEFTAQITSIMSQGYASDDSSVSLPQSQFARSRDAQRRADITAVAAAIRMYQADNSGQYPIGLTYTPADIGTSGLNLASVLIPKYLSRLPKDPVSGTDSITGYVAWLDAEGQVVVTGSPETELYESLQAIH